MASDASDPSAPVDPWSERILPRPSSGRWPTPVRPEPAPVARPAPAPVDSPPSQDQWAQAMAAAPTSVVPAPPPGPTGPTGPAGPSGPDDAGPTGPGDEPITPGPGRRPRRKGHWLIEWAVVLVVALGVAIGIRTFVVQTFYIPSASMQPTLMIGDRILVDKVSYHLHDVHRGDIVVFGRPPLERSAVDIKDLVKRVIGLPGETISSVDGKVTINGKPLSEPWLPSPDPLGQPITTIKIPAGDYFVMGDNRSNSQDSRFFGPIPHSLIVGRVVLRIWPLSHISFF